ncbi:hypothetical protein MWU65_04030 [Cellulophaga sp. F20128]|uniref:hypothetical protein n=1 Tax=Cellulophaga sp. F20128 TaxID=2926413 RepID=UPI001FF2612F|nr:hypothetical protein [Cellulophaga sp. F20128]MCK0156334.1 hypothetical protein [Cellulophaga sp. F20128]
MNNEYAKSERENIEKYQAKGYERNYKVVQGALVDVDTKEIFKPEEIFVVKEYRYEGMSNPSDLSILYIIETNTNSKGTLLIGYGPTGDLDASEFFKAIPKKNYSS